MVPKIDEDHARFWDLLLKGFGIVAAIITLVIGFRTIKGQGNQLKFQQQQLSEQQSQFEASYKEQIKALEEEYHRRFWEKKLEAYLQLCHVNRDFNDGRCRLRRV
jgi:hypothetical protein